MLKLLASAACLTTLLLNSLPAQQQQQPPPAAPGAEADEVVRITTNLVQIDAVVVDKDGKHVPDLTPADFEIYEDGRRRDITNFSYVADDAAEFNNAAAAPRGKAIPPAAAPPSAPLRPEQVQRTIAVVVDDLRMSFESLAYVREALKRFVTEQMRPGDLVAIVRTSSGVGALQQFTADRHHLFAAAESIRWGFRRGRGNVYGSLSGGAIPSVTNDLYTGGTSLRATENFDEEESFYENLLAAGTLGAINHTVQGMRELPGRKSVLFVADGLELLNPAADNYRILQAVRRLTDNANRASVVIYTLDARGLPVLNITAAENTSRMSPQTISEAPSVRRSEYRKSQEGMHYLARQTGGFFVFNTTDLAGGVRRIVADQRGYYLIGYRPETETFRVANGKRDFHRLEVKIKRPGLSVRTRTGFFGVTDEEARPAAPTREQQLYSALTSPFGSGDIAVQLTPLFANDARAGSFMRALLHIDAANLTFTEEADGWHKTSIDVAAVTVDGGGDVIDQIDRVHSVKTRGETFDDVRRHGMVYTLDVPVKKAGAYQLRMAVRDSASGRVGSASQFIEVPDVGKKRLALSGMLLHGQDSSASASSPPAEPDGAAATIKASAKEDDSSRAAAAHPAVRRLKPGATLNYTLMIYNARLDRATARPQLRSQVRMFRDDKLIFVGKDEAVSLAEQLADPRRIFVGGVLRLGANMTPGRYALQLSVTDALAEDKKRAGVAQWMDFEVAN